MALNDCEPSNRQLSLQRQGSLLQPAELAVLSLTLQPGQCWRTMP